MDTLIDLVTFALPKHALSLAMIVTALYHAASSVPSRRAKRNHARAASPAARRPLHAARPA